MRSGWSRAMPDRKSTRLNSSHLGISYAVFCLKKIRAGRKILLRDPLDCAGGAGFLGQVGAVSLVQLRHVVNLLRLQLQFFFNDTAPTEIYTLSLHDALPI